MSLCESPIDNGRLRKDIRRVGTRKQLTGDIPLEIERSMAKSRKLDILEAVFEPLRWNQTIPPPGIARYFLKLKHRIDSHITGPCHIPYSKIFICAKNIC